MPGLDGPLSRPIFSWHNEMIQVRVVLMMLRTLATTLPRRSGRFSLLQYRYHKQVQMKFEIHPEIQTMSSVGRISPACGPVNCSIRRSTGSFRCNLGREAGEICEKKWSATDESLCSAHSLQQPSLSSSPSSDTNAILPHQQLFLCVYQVEQLEVHVYPAAAWRVTSITVQSWCLIFYWCLNRENVAMILVIIFDAFQYSQNLLRSVTYCDTHQHLDKKESLRETL